MHTLMDLRGSIPTLINVSDGKVHEVNFLDRILPEAGAIYVMGRGYVDFACLYHFTLEHAFFVTRSKSNMVYKVVESRPIVPGNGARSDQIIVLEGATCSKDYPEWLRRIRFGDVETYKTLDGITNLKSHYCIQKLFNGL